MFKRNDLPDFLDEFEEQCINDEKVPVCQYVYLWEQVCCVSVRNIVYCVHVYVCLSVCLSVCVYVSVYVSVYVCAVHKCVHSCIYLHSLGGGVSF